MDIVERCFLVAGLTCFFVMVGVAILSLSLAKGLTKRSYHGSLIRCRAPCANSCWLSHVSAEGDPARGSPLGGVCLDSAERNAFLARITAVKGADEGDRVMQALRKLQAMLST